MKTIKSPILWLCMLPAVAPAVALVFVVLLATCAPRRTSLAVRNTAPQTTTADPLPVEYVDAIIDNAELIGKSISEWDPLYNNQVIRKIGFDTLCAVGTDAQNRPGLHDRYLRCKAIAKLRWPTFVEDCPCFRD